MDLVVKCIECSAEEFESQNIKCSPTVKNEIVEITIVANVCQKCGLPQLSDEQVNRFRKTAIDQYRKRHNLLTSQNIIQLRESLEMSQKAFAQFLGVDLDSIQRWETYEIQDRAQDLYIRQKCAAHLALN